jgi:hypothetical protein
MISLPSLQGHKLLIEGTLAGFLRPMDQRGIGVNHELSTILL